MKIRAYLFATTIFALVPTIAFAQVQTTTNPAPSGAVGSSIAPAQTGLGEIIVTAQRQSESSQKAAIPLNVLQGAALLSSGVTQVDRLSSLAPALSIEPTNTGSLIFVRGVGNFTLTANSDPAIAFNYDGVYVGRPTSTTGVFYDLDRVEVLKGPQGILYGRNATAGAINVLPAQPKLGDLSAYASVAYGNYNTVNAEGAINLPAGENGAFRLSFARSSHDGYLSDGTSDENTWAGRVQAKAKLTPNLTFRLAADFAHNGGKGSGIDYVGDYMGTPSGPTTFVPSGIPVGTGINAPQSQAYYTGLTFQPLGNHLPPLPEPFQNNMFYGVNAQIDYSIPAGTFTFIPAWRNAHLDYFANAGAIPYLDNEKDNQYSAELRFVGNRIGPIDYQVGGYFFDEQIHTRTEVNNSNLSQYQRENFNTKSYAGFGRLTFHVTDRFRLVGGLRFTQDEKRFSTNQLNAIIVCTAAAGCPQAPTTPSFNDFSQITYASQGTFVPIFGHGIPFTAFSITSTTLANDALRNHKLTYRAAAEFDLTPRSLLYGSVESGYRSGGFSVATGFESYQPETITAYTVGLKNRFLQNRVQLNLEGFLWNYRNQQVTHVGPDLTGTTAYFTQNIGSSKIYGAEVDGKVLITPTTLFSTDVQYLHTKQKNFNYLQGGNPEFGVNAAFITNSSQPFTGCAFAPAPAAQRGRNPVPYAVDCSGNPSYNSPKWTLNFSGQQTIKFDPFKVLVTVDTQYRSSRDIGFAYLAQQRVGPTWTTNAQIEFGPSNDRWSIAAYVRNIENDRIPVYSQQGGTNGLLLVTTSAPRTYGLRATAKY